MNDMIPCGNHEALISYVYEECEPAEREFIASHVALCASCAEQIQTLRDTRAHLGAWTPPSLALGFQLTRTESDPPAKVLRPAVWWRQPLPGWAQVAAAAVIFAAGMGVSGLRSDESRPAAVQAGQPAVASLAPIAAVSTDDLARLDARIRSVETAQAQVPAQLQRTAAPAIDERELFARINAMVDERVAQSQLQNIRYLDRFARELDDTRGAMQEELLTQRREVRTALPMMMRASLQGDSR